MSELTESFVVAMLSSLGIKQSLHAATEKTLLDYARPITEKLRKFAI
jgi:hypothetical protein